MPIELKLNAPQAVQGSNDAIELPPLFDPTVTVKKSAITFGTVLGAQVGVACISYLLADPAFQAYLGQHLTNKSASALVVAGLAATGTALRNWLKNRNSAQ